MLEKLGAAAIGALVSAITLGLLAGYYANRANFCDGQISIIAAQMQQAQQAQQAQRTETKK